MNRQQEFRKQTEEAKLEAFSLMCKKVAELEKENAELKERNRELDTILTGESLLSNGLEEQLTNAKKLLKQWVELYKPKLEGYPIPPIQEQTEQFLKEEL